MWSSGHNVDDDGEPVLLLMPAAANEYRPRGRKKNKNSSSKSDPSSSHAGGLPCYHAGDARPPSFPSSLSYSPSSFSSVTTNPECTTCGNRTHLLLQLHSPVDECDRTLYVFGCNNRTCHPRTTASTTTRDNNVDVGEGGGDASVFRSFIGSGPVRCIRSQRPWTAGCSKMQGPMTTPTARCGVGDDDDPPPRNGTTTRNDDYWDADDAAVDGGGWGDDDGHGDDGDDDWGVGGGVTSDGADVSMDDLEAMMNECEMIRPTTTASKHGTRPLSLSSPSRASREQQDADDADECGGSSTTATSDALPSFERIDLLTMNEPPARRRRGGGDDSDDDDGDDYDYGDEECEGGKDSKVERMLSRYMDMEDDEEILSALRGGLDVGSGHGFRGGGSGVGGERYERLPPEEQAFLSFTRRLRRAPGQVCRYAYGGSPLWSVPATPPPSRDATVDRGRHGVSEQRRGKQKYKKTSKAQRGKDIHPYSQPAVPDCACGHGRVFEFQILPSLLHVLDVDGHATAVGASGEEDEIDDDDVLGLINNGGMNWGSIAVYSCPLSCDDSREEFVVVLEAVDDAPTINDAGKGDDSDGDD